MPSRYDKAIVVGDACMDVHVQLKYLLSNMNERSPYHMSLGGTCGGALFALSKLGVETAFLGTIGNDYGGKFLLGELNKLGIDTSTTIVDDELNTVSVFALIDEEGERHLWGFPREKQSYSVLDMDKIDFDRIKTASWLHSSGMTMISGGSIRKNLPEIFRIAYEAGVETSFDLNTRVSDINELDPDWVEAIRKILPYVRYLTGSGKDEFVSFHPCENWKDSVRYFANDNRIVIARNGKEGFFLVDGDREVECPSYDVETINTTGAGDSFNAGFIASMLEGKDVLEAAKYANAVAGYIVSRDEKLRNVNKEEIKKFIENTALRKQ